MPRLRDLGIAIGDGAPGPRNSITDVAGVLVGHRTVTSEDDTPGPVVRTGVTVVMPRADWPRRRPCFAAAHAFNGNGECTGLEWIRESGLLTAPIAITTTHSVGVVRDALVAADTERHAPAAFWSMPVVAETYDGLLSDPYGQHVTAQHVSDALDALSADVQEGAVGGGTGMVCHEFKGGIGTASRVLPREVGGWTVGVLVQANYGLRRELRVDGRPVGRALGLDRVRSPRQPLESLPAGAGSIIVVVATDAPLLPDQCRRLAVRAGVGLSRMGGGTGDDSGDIFVAFATGNDAIPPETYDADVPHTVSVWTVPHQHLRPLFDASADATEEAIVNALLASKTTVGAGGRVAHSLSPELLLEAWHGAI